MLKSMRKSKNRYFYHIFVSHGDAPGAITLNVVWMEREFDAYKLSRSMCSETICISICLSITVFEIQRDIREKIGNFSYPLVFDAPVRGSRRNIGIPFGSGKLEWCRCPMVKKFRRYLYSFWRNSGT